MVTVMNYQKITAELHSMADPVSAAGLARYGIRTENLLGVSIPKLRSLGKRIGQNHSIAKQLWSSGIHDARILAGMVAEPGKLTERQMETWVKDFDSWDVCDQCCSNLFDKTPFAHEKAAEWAGRKQEFVKRAGFVMMAVLAVHDKKANDEAFTRFFPLIRQEATDERNFVKKAVNWAIRQIGKRNASLNQEAIRLAKEIGTMNSKSARWIAADALRELTSSAVQRRLAKKK
jgi:3-methyladenine DNA glycosylase AlkD